MIHFPCHCGFNFELPLDQSGGVIQCPKCGRLNDIPSVDELRNLDEDGTFRVGDAPPAHDPDRFAEMYRAFSKDKRASDGSEIDLRQSLEEIEKIGVSDDEIPLAGESAPHPAPKYDPETGELIKAMEIRPDDAADINQEEIPMARAALEYATVGGPSDITGKFPATELLKPINLAVMLFAWIDFIAYSFIMLLPLLGFLGILIWIPLMAHFANVIEDIGPDDRDELPRFMRDFSFGPDLWWPWCRVAVAAWCCFFIPVLIPLTSIPEPIRDIVTIGFWLIALTIYPAVLLTTTTSGTVLNLRPDRVIGVMGVIGGRYVWLVVVCVAAHMMLLASAGLMANDMWRMFFHHQLIATSISGWPVYILAAFAIYVMHYFCWQLGLMYRKHHEKFPWILQRFVSDRKIRFPRSRPPKRVRAEKPKAWPDRYKKTGLPK